MSQITILLLYLLAGAGFARPRLKNRSRDPQSLDTFAGVLALIGTGLHAFVLTRRLFPGGLVDFGLANAVSLLALEVAVVAVIACVWPRLRGLSALALLSAALVLLPTLFLDNSASPAALDVPLKVHAIASVVANSLVFVGAILALAALIQEQRLRRARMGGWGNLLPPLAEMERLTYAIAGAGFVMLLVAVATGFAFIDNLFAQHLVHKTTLSLLALALFGTLLAGRQLAGWRGRPALTLYLAGFATLVLAYFGSKFVLEILLDRQWWAFV